MCGILAALGLKGDPEELRRMMLRQSKLIRHRGPDATAIWQSAQSAADTVSFLSFERLQILTHPTAASAPHLPSIMARYRHRAAALLDPLCLI